MDAPIAPASSELPDKPYLESFEPGPPRAAAGSAARSPLEVGPAVLELKQCRLRLPDARDLAALHAQKNDPEVALLLGGHSDGYSYEDIVAWLERHTGREDEIVWTIADRRSDACLGHVGLYQLDRRVRSADFGIMIGAKWAQGRGLGKEITRAVLRYGFETLNLNRIGLSVLSTNERARRLYRRLGFHVEGVLRQAQIKRGRYVDMVLMSLLEAEWRAGAGDAAVERPGH